MTQIVCSALKCIFIVLKNFTVDGAWQLWTVWGDCSVSCGGGLRNRTRDCINPEHGGAACEGPSEQAENCNEHPCPSKLHYCFYPFLYLSRDGYTFRGEEPFSFLSPFSIWVKSYIEKFAPLGAIIFFEKKSISF